MKLLLLLTTLTMPFSASAFTINNVNVLKTAQNPRKITSFSDFIATDEQLKKYYKGINNLKGEDLIVALENIINKNNTKPKYSGSISGGHSWSTYFLLDRDYEKSPLTTAEIDALNSGKTCWWNDDKIYVAPLYEPNSIELDYRCLNKSSGPGPQRHFDREHVVPKSYGFNGTGDENFENTMAGCDMHNLHMGESYANQTAHNDRVYGNVASKIEESRSKNTNVVNAYSGKHATFSDTVFEPLDVDKGDIARSTFYMGTRYHTYSDIAPAGTGPSPSILIVNNPIKESSTVTPSSTKNSPATFGILDDLLEWNTLDTVTDHEKIRNTLCEKFIQGNRNPFIDFPLWADIAYNPNTSYVADINSPNGIKKAEEVDPSVPENPEQPETDDPTEPEIPVEDTLSVATNLELEYKTNQVLNLKNVKFQYIENGVKQTVPYNELTYTLKNKLNQKSVTIEDGYKLKQAGDFELKISYQTPSNIILETTTEFKVKKAPFYEDPKFKKMVIIVGAVILALIVIGLVIVIIKKSRKK